MSKPGILRELKGILQDLKFLIQTDQFPILKKQGELDPNDLDLNWKESWNWPLVSSSKPQASMPGIQVRTPVKKDDRNFTCKLCPDRLSAVRHFLIRGRKKILVLHYTGETSPGKESYVKTSPLKVFRSPEAENVFDRMIQKVFGFTMKEFYYQEFPGCLFSQDRSNESDWKRRTENCRIQVNETVQEEGIQGIILLGAAATLLFGKEEATKQMGKTLEFQPGVPMIVLRSPEAILAAEQKRKSSKSESPEFQDAKKKEIEIKESILSQLGIFHTEVKERI
ncbi:hypothetical protein EHO59_14660 [Leptospira semungkisensis]|uniref:Uracil-DNA glycosylase n=1 Tax=Leptospira semungkisensis TaxID=2484985 RepID=A0A4V3JAN3_9LEPT|nr:hypothetical protein [Leptospira semungkisensis]TGJ99118.1 hypothetical protein EHO59_14660 [Leptospira semungkisensis]